MTEIFVYRRYFFPGIARHVVHRRFKIAIEGETVREPCTRVLK